MALVVVALAAWLSWDSIRLLWYFEPLGRNAEGYSEHRHRKTGIVFVLLPGGRFLMGAQSAEPAKPNHDPDAQPDESPVHEVILSPFLISKHEVTQAQWRAVMGDNPSSFKGDDLPVENVSWEECREFCRRTGLALPTEAEWEYACRAGTTGPFAGTGILEDLGWYEVNSGGRTHPVGQKAPNGFGLHDVHGNVWEWCEDIYDEGFYGRPEASGPDPVSGSGSGHRVCRGGGWGTAPGACRAADRGGSGPSDRIGDLGLRPSRPLR